MHIYMYMYMYVYAYIYVFTSICDRVIYENTDCRKFLGLSLSVSISTSRDASPAKYYTCAALRNLRIDTMARRF